MQRGHFAVLPVVKRFMATGTAASPHKIIQRDDTSVRPLPKDDSVKSSRLPNGLTVVSLENNSPVSRITAIFKAGSRYETSENIGVVHRLRNSIGYTMGGMTSIKLNYELSNAGGFFECTASRDFLSYDLHCIRQNLLHAVLFSLTPLCDQKFTPFDLKENIASMNIDHRELRDNATAYALDMLHSAAYRNSSMANSICSPKRMIGHHSTGMLKEFVGNHLVSGNCALVGVGVDHEFLLKIADQAFPVKEGRAVATPPAKYGGGEIRKNGGGHLATVAIAAEGVSFSDPKAAATQAVLASVLGTGPHVKWSGGVSRLSKAVSGATSDPFFVTALNLMYSDTGLFGIQYMANGKDSGKVAKAVIGEFRKVSSQGVNDNELKAAQARLKVGLLARAESGHNVVEDLSIQTMVRPGSYVNAGDVTKLVDGVTANDVQQAAKKILGSKLSMAAVGNLDNTPYIDEL